MIGDNKKQKGFTLLEIVIASGLFGLIATTVVGVFLVSIRAQNTVLAEKRVAENVNFALEFMSRQMRTAPRDDAGSCATAGETFTSATSTEIDFLNQEGTCIHIELVGGAIEYTEGVEDPTALTDNTVASIDNLNFYLQGESSSDNEQPRVRIVIEASGITQRTSGVTINTQTTVSSRNLDTP